MAGCNQLYGGCSRKIYINWAPENPGDYLDSAIWTSEILPSSDGLMQWMFAVSMQVDGINGLDFIAGAKESETKIGWFQSPEDPRILSNWKWNPIRSATWVMSLILRDMDNDGDLNVLTCEEKYGPDSRGLSVTWFENPHNVKSN